MARSGVTVGPVRKGARAAAERKDEVTQALHHLGNNVHSLALRLLVLQSSDLPADARSHLDAAHRLAQQSANLVEHLHELLQGAPPMTRPRRTAPSRRSRSP